jgi:hypothetical protein
MSDGYWGHCFDLEPDWQQVAADYDTIWSYGDQRYQRHINEVATKIFEEPPLILYRVRKQKERSSPE